MFPLVEYLMDPDRNIDIEPRNDNEETPLHYAALQGQLEVVKYLIFKVKNKKPMDKFGKTPLDRAQSNGHQDIVDFLLNPQGTIHILRRIFFTPPLLTVDWFLFITWVFTFWLLVLAFI